MFFNDRTGFLRVRATVRDLDKIELEMKALNADPPQLTIEVKFAEVSEDQPGALDLLSLIGYAPGTNGRAQIVRLPPSMQFASKLQPAEFTGILTAQQCRALVRVLEEHKGVDLLSMPRVTTLSGRQAQIKVVDVKYIVTGFGRGAKGVPQRIAEPMEFGPTLDVVPFVSADGYTIQMTVIPTVKEFLGYDRTERVAGDPQTAMILPIFRTRQVVASATVWDGQTVVVGVGSVEVERKPEPGATGLPKRIRKSLFVLVTPTIIDPAGNRVHAPEDMPFANQAVPLQKPVP
jgi:type II secretory pathway component GspD/PulD (secretin)